MSNAEPSVYELAGGMPFFVGLVDRFYDGVAEDPLLRPLYPSDLEPPRWRLARFLAQYWGGPTTYGQERGHPRLRMRHAPFTIDVAARDAWLVHMRAAVDSMAPPDDVRAALLEYFEYAAESMRNA